MGQNFLSFVVPLILACCSPQEAQLAPVLVLFVLDARVPHARSRLTQTPLDSFFYTGLLTWQLKDVESRVYFIISCVDCAQLSASVGTATHISLTGNF